MGFEATKTVTALEYNFRPHVDAQGCTPEPSDKAVRHFLFESSRIAQSIRGDEDDEVDVLKRVQDLSEEDYEKVAEQLLDLIAELTQGQPTRDEISALPHRIQRAYMSWLRKELTDPEAPSVATKPSLRGLQGGALTTRPAGS